MQLGLLHFGQYAFLFIFSWMISLAMCIHVGTRSECFRAKSACVKICLSRMQCHMFLKQKRLMITIELNEMLQYSLSVFASFWKSSRKLCMETHFWSSLNYQCQHVHSEYEAVAISCYLKLVHSICTLHWLHSAGVCDLWVYPNVWTTFGTNRTERVDRYLCAPLGNDVHTIWSIWRNVHTHRRHLKRKINGKLIKLILEHLVTHALN